MSINNGLVMLADAMPGETTSDDSFENEKALLVHHPIEVALIDWSVADRQMWGAKIKRLHLGTARRLSNTTSESLFADLRQILAPEYVARVREVATHRTTPVDSAATTCDLLEDFARLMRVDATGGRIWRGTAAP